MPRHATGRNEKQRLRQQRYRSRLAVLGEPEVAELDTAAAVAVARLVIDLEQGKAVSGSRDLLDTLLRSAVDSLKSQGYNGRAAGRLMHRRLTWLKESFKDANATWYTKRGVQV
ncbi:hypothetical protein [Rhizobium leguminosarum]|jgi:hypothetical protein|uniref:Uncharacterized protein n=1 Tax=Rhizobium leguminosarum TaxID=384 RepID=A0A7M3DQQ9_RHILE|nr:hypothetical protein [Rhizobium leguminosarum]TAY50962.1 hypothetical protein ELH90_04185 [Rhizobium leguminosarum]